jgi:hypothetical protein
MGGVLASRSTGFTRLWQGEWPENEQPLPSTNMAGVRTLKVSELYVSSHRAFSYIQHIDKQIHLKIQ